MSEVLEYLVALPSQSAEEAIALIHFPNVKCLQTTKQVWLRLQGKVEELNAAVAYLRSGIVYQIVNSQLLLRKGSCVPESSLPQGDWQDLNDVVRFHLPKALYSELDLDSVSHQRAKLMVVRSGIPKPLGLLLLEIHTLQQWVESVSACRFESLEFAVSTDRKVLLQGEHLPTLAGTCFHLHEQVAIEAGYRFSPHVSHLVVRKMLNLIDDELAIYFGNQNFWRCGRIEFVPLKRTALRNTVAALT